MTPLLKLIIDNNLVVHPGSAYSITLRNLSVSVSQPAHPLPVNLSPEASTFGTLMNTDFWIDLIFCSSFSYVII